MKIRSLSPMVRIALLGALGLILLCAILAFCVSASVKNEDSVTLDTGGHGTLTDAKNGQSLLLSAGGDEYFSANWFPTLSGAKGDGTGDDTDAIQESLRQAAVLGGTVYLPRGTYRISRPITVPAGVTLRGDFTSPDASSSGRTVLSAMEGDALSSAPLITLENGANLVGITVYYEAQIPTNLREYPATVHSLGAAEIRNLALINPYQGICASGNGAVEISSVWMSPLDYGILVAENSQNVILEDISFSPTYWLNSVPELFASRGAYEGLTSFLNETLHGIILEQVNDVAVHRYTADDAGVGLLLNVPAERDAMLRIAEVQITATPRPLYVQSVPASGVLFSDCTFRPSIDAGADTVFLGAEVKGPVIFSACTFSGSPKTVIHGENSSFVSFYHCDFGTWWNSCFDMSDSTFLAVAPTFRTSADRALLGLGAFGLLYSSEALEDSSELLFSVVPENAVLAGSTTMGGLKDSNRTTATAAKIFYASDFGVSTAAADNSAALAAALAAAAEEKGIVFLAEGNYRFLSTVTVPESVRLIGAGNKGAYSTTLTFDAAQGLQGSLIRPEKGASVEQLILHQGSGGEGIFAVSSESEQVRLRRLSITAEQGVCLVNGAKGVLEHLSLNVTTLGIRLQSCTDVTLRDVSVADISATHTLVGLSVTDSQVTLSEFFADRCLQAIDITGVSKVSATLLALRKSEGGISIADRAEVFLSCVALCNEGTSGPSRPLTLTDGKLTVQGMLCKGSAPEGELLSAAGGSADLRAALISATLPIGVQSTGEGTVSVTGCIFNATPTYHAKATDGTVSFNGNLLISDKVFEGIEGNYLLISEGGESTVEDGTNVMKFTYVPPEDGGSESGTDSSDRVPENENVTEQ